MAITRKNIKTIFNGKGIPMPPGRYHEIDNILLGILNDLADRSKAILKSQNKMKLTADTLELAYEKHKESHLSELAEKLKMKLIEIINQGVDEIATQYRQS